MNSLLLAIALTHAAPQRLPAKEIHRLPRWYCTAQATEDEHVSHSTVATTEHTAKRNATKECRYFHPDSAGCRVRCWKL